MSRTGGGMTWRQTKCESISDCVRETETPLIYSSKQSLFYIFLQQSQATKKLSKYSHLFSNLCFSSPQHSSHHGILHISLVLPILIFTLPSPNHLLLFCFCRNHKKTPPFFKIQYAALYLETTTLSLQMYGLQLYYIFHLVISMSTFILAT